MIKKVITKSDGNTINLKYDEKSYDIEYVNHKNMIILRRLSDNKVIEIFSDKIGFIVQCNIGDKTNFLVTDYSKTDEYGNKLLIFNHYTDRFDFDSLQLEKLYKCTSAALSVTSITDASYLIGAFSPSCIYSLENKLKKFDRIYNDERIKEIFNDNTVLVSEKKSAYMRSDEINDTLTYGINPETFEITTPIWSELQQRWINIYTQEQVTKLKEELANKGEAIAEKHLNDLNDLTIYYEVEIYLNKLAEHLEKPKSVYTTALPECKLNEEFVKKFVLKK